MNGTRYQIAIHEIAQVERERLTLDELAASAGLHPDLIERFIEYGLIEPAQSGGARTLFDVDCVARLRKIERLRRDLGANTAGAAVILDLLDRIGELQKEVERLRNLAP